MFSEDKKKKEYHDKLDNKLQVSHFTNRAPNAFWTSNALHAVEHSCNIAHPVDTRVVARGSVEVPDLCWTVPL